MASSAVRTFDRENENYFRFSALLLDLGTDVLREVFSSYYSPKPLKEYLAGIQVAGIIKQRLKGKVLADDQNDILYPKDGSPPNANVFDITLLCALIRNLSVSTRVSDQVWTSPSPANKSLEADVTRIRLARNVLHGHTAAAKLSNSEFHVETQKLEQAYTNIIQRLPSPSMTVSDLKKKFQHILTSPIDDKHYLDQKDRLNTWLTSDTQQQLQIVADDTRAIKDNLAEQQQKASSKEEELRKLIMSSLQERKKEPQMIEKRIRDTKLLLDEHSKQREVYEIELRSYEEVHKMLKKNNYVFITGGPGSGKSFMAKSVLQQLVYSDERMKPMRIYSAAEWLTLVDSDAHICVFVDDFLGKYGVIKSELNDWKRKTDIILPCLEKGNVKMIATVRTSIMKQVTASYSYYCEYSTSDFDRLLKKECILDLSSNEHRMSSDERLKMLQTYIRIDGIDLKHEKEEDICLVQNLVGFPQSCRMLKAVPSDLDKVSAFKQPTEFLMFEIENLFKHDRFQYAVLAAVMLFGGKFSLDDLEDGSPDIQKMHSVLEICGLHKDRLLEIGANLNYLTDVFVNRESGNIYSFLHDTIHAVVFRSFFDKFQKRTLKLCSLCILTKVCHGHEQDTIEDTNIPKDTWERVNVKQEDFHMIESRFVDAIQTRESSFFQQVSEAALWRCTQFRDRFIQQNRFAEFATLTDKLEQSILVHASAVANVPLITCILRYASIQSFNKGEWFIDQLNKGLTAACKNQKLEIVEMLLDQVNQTPDGAMFEAVNTGNVRIVKLLFEKKGNTEIRRNIYDDSEMKFSKNPGSESLLLSACFRGKEDVVNYLLEKIPVAIPSEATLSLLQVASAGGNIRILEKLISMGFNPRLGDDHYATILHFACTFGREQIAEYIWKKYPELINVKADQACTPLHCAMNGGNINLVEKFIDAGADTNARRNIGASMLSEACFSGNADMIKYVAEKFTINVHDIDADGWTSIHFAMLTGNVSSLEFLLHHFDPFVITYDGRTLLHIACQTVNKDVAVHLVREFPVMVNSEDKFGWLPVHCAAFAGSLSLVRQLVVCGSKIDKRTKKGKLPLDISISKMKEKEEQKDLLKKKNYSDVTEYLLKVTSRATGNKTCLDPVKSEQRP